MRLFIMTIISIMLCVLRRKPAIIWLFWAWMGKIEGPTGYYQSKYFLIFLAGNRVKNGIMEWY